MKITSSKFKHKGIIPSIYTCEGKGISPPLEFEDIPKGAKSLVLIMDDPDVPRSVREDQMFDHWVVFNIDPKTTSIVENQPPPGTQGKNTAGKNVYYPPCPPDKEHRYFFKLYAIDTTLKLKEGATKKEVEDAIDGHIIEKSELIGLYEKGKGY